MKGEGKNESWNFRHLRYVFLQHIHHRLQLIFGGILWKT